MKHSFFELALLHTCLSMPVTLLLHQLSNFFSKFVHRLNANLAANVKTSLDTEREAPESLILLRTQRKVKQSKA